MKTLSERIKLLHTGYQGMDDKNAIIREIERLEASNAVLEASTRSLEVSLQFWISKAEELQEYEWKYKELCK